MSTQKGGFYPGMILGFLLGVAISLGVGLYVTKAPVPFINKVPQRSSAYDAAEAERNRNWDPNTALQGRNPARPAAPAAPQPQSQSQPQPSSPYYPDTPPPAEAPSARMPSEAPALRTPAEAPVARTPADPAATRPAERSASTRDPAAILSGGSTAAEQRTTGYFVQTGAFARMEDAEQQRARLAMLGLSARITERDQSGRVVYRVRVGPFDAREDAESTRDRVAGSGLDAALVSAQR